MKNPLVAAIFSLFFPGRGQMYNGQIWKGVLFSVIQFVNISLIEAVIGMVTTPVFLLYAVYDAYRVADLMPISNRENNLSKKQQANRED